jgi:hypothetical protein
MPWLKCLAGEDRENVIRRLKDSSCIPKHVTVVATLPGRVHIHAGIPTINSVSIVTPLPLRPWYLALFDMDNAADMVSEGKLKVIN